MGKKKSHFWPRAATGDDARRHVVFFIFIAVAEGPYYAGG